MNHNMATAATASAGGEDHNNRAAGGGGGGGVLQGQIISHRVMERPSQEQIQLQQQPLKCPRCDSTNTKFCYYNNYSLSQPRHFCKACKRYWTRGGTLRNVPVGGGCRKNKRFRRPIIPPPTSNSFNSNCASSSSSAAACSTSTPNTTSAHVLGCRGVSNPAVPHDAMNHHQFNPMFYGGGGGSLISDHHHQMNFPFSRYDDLPHQPENLGLGFSSSPASGFISSANYNPKQILQDLAASNYHTSFGSHDSNGTTATTLSTTISSMLFEGSSSSNSALGGRLKENLNGNNFQSFLPFGDQQNMQMHVKMENGQLVLRNTMNSHNQNENVHHDMVISSPSSDPPSLMWTSGTHASTNWLDPSSNVGSSSVPLL